MAPAGAGKTTVGVSNPFPKGANLICDSLLTTWREQADIALATVSGHRLHGV